MEKIMWLMKWGKKINVEKNIDEEYSNIMD